MQAGSELSGGLGALLGKVIEFGATLGTFVGTDVATECEKTLLLAGWTTCGEHDYPAKNEINQVQKHEYGEEPSDKLHSTRNKGNRNA